MSEVTQTMNPLGTAPIGKTLAKFAVPAIISNLITSIYNITDQIFIGQNVGILGNAATNVAYPISIICTAVAILFGFGGAASLNLEMGRGNREKGSKIVGTTFGCLIISGVLISLIVGIFLEPMLWFFGATEQNISYATTYVSIINVGIPFLLFSTGGSHLIRADGKPTYSMIAVIVGAVLNVVLDAVFVPRFGMAGVAWATVTSQIVSGILILLYLPRYQSFKLKIRDFIPKWESIKAVVPLGTSVCINQVAILVQQIATSNVLREYGAQSIYGSDIPLAAMGIISKVSMLVTAVVLGIAQGGQPILGFNYGAKNFDRVRKTFRCIIVVSFVFSCVAFVCFQIFPEAIVKLFGTENDALYMEFAVSLMQIYLFFTFVNGCQPISANAFPALGKPLKGVCVSLSRPLLFLIPLFLLPKFIGISGVAYAGLMADGITFLFAAVMWIIEFKKMPIKQVNQ
ncbi:MAG TPA: MATE family efflux transporter [Clostridiales bacterium]|jgi:putative MATE family efflux protein|nr:MATE family efflux transporter [Clostridiales bacterium]HBL81465.1 MATE family efflux transporter [Clostridiales bacterium]